MRTLVFLTENRGQVVAREQFFDSVWHGRVVNEEALSRAISLLRTALEDDAHRPTYIQTIPGMGYRLIAPVSHSSPAVPCVTTLPTADRNSIAVLPFVNLSDDSDNEYFSDGISEEILNCLAQVNSFKVVGRTSSFALKGKNKDLRKIGQMLDVCHVLEGSVRKAGERVRITAQLIKTEDGYHLWSDTFDFELDDIFAVQDQIASAVVDALKTHILGERNRARETSVPAYSLYLKAMHFLRSGEIDRISKALHLFQEVSAIDEGYAPAWVGQADAYWYLISYGELTKGGHVNPAMEAIVKALELDDKLAEAYLSKANLYQGFNQDWRVSQQSIDRARQLSPGSARVILQAGNLASSVGQFEESVRLLSQAVSLDPLNTTGHIWLALSLVTLGRLDEARAILVQALDVHPQRVVANLILGKILLLEGEATAAHEQMQLEPAGFWRDYGLALSLYAIKQYDAAEAALQDLIERCAHEAPFQIAEIHALRAENDQAFFWLEKAREERDNGLTELLGSPSLVPLRRDPRWAGFVKKMDYP